MRKHVHPEGHHNVIAFHDLEDHNGRGPERKTCTDKSVMKKKKNAVK